MTTDDDLKAAEEYCKTLKINPNHTMSLTDLTFDGEGNLVTIQSVFLAGLAAGREEAKWIKCSELMPEEDDPILIYLPRKAPARSVHIAEHRTNAGSYFWDPACGGIKASEVTHWMPLPQSPTEENQ